MQIKNTVLEIAKHKHSRFAGSTIFLYITIQNDKSGQIPNNAEIQISGFLYFLFVV